MTRATERETMERRREGEEVETGIATTDADAGAESKKCLLLVRKTTQQSANTS
jgi:hypothetical protein